MKMNDNVRTWLRSGEYDICLELLTLGHQS